MNEKNANIQFLSKGLGLATKANTGVSLHCHSLHSKELLDFVPYYACRIPVVKYLWKREMRRRRRLGHVPDFTTGYWEPPLTGHDVLTSECKNLEKLGLNGIVSITDHDSINANLELKADAADLELPISMEWTVPFQNAFFHIGVHNLPANRANEIADRLVAYTKAPGPPNDTALTSLFERLNDIADLLVVFNHPIWDIEMIGQEAHENALRVFLSHHSKWIHAIEVNGFRSWSENSVAIKLAEAVGLPVVSGGDRHCCHPNTMFNTTNASTFAEFVSEVRYDHFSRIAVTPEYHTPLPSRQLASMRQILADYDHFPTGRQLWSDRVFLDGRDGKGMRSLTDQWDGNRPAWTFLAMLILRLMANSMSRQVIEVLVGDVDVGRNEVVSSNLENTLEVVLRTGNLNPKSI